MVRRRREDDFDDDDEDIERPIRRRRRANIARGFGVRRVLLLGLVLGVLLVVFAPRIASLRLFRPLVSGLIADKFNGRLEWSQISLGWFSPINIREARLYDGDGHLVVSVEQFRTSQSLLSLIWNSNDLGRIELNRPTGDLILRAGGSNLEDVLAPILTAETEDNAQVPRAILEWTAGELRLSSATGIPPSQLSELQGKIHIGDANAGVAFSASGKIHGKAASAGRFEMEGSAGAPGTINFDQGRLLFRAEDTPIDMLALIAARLGESLESNGLFSGETTLAWSAADGTDVELKNIRATNLTLGGSRWLQSDRLTIAQLTAAGRVALAGSRITADQLRCQTEFGEINASGAMDWRQLAAAIAGGPLPDTDFQFGGSLDVARLSQMMPTTLRLRNGVQIQTAVLDFQSFSRLEGGRRRLLIDAEAKDLLGIRDNQPIRWTKPVRLSAAFVQGERQTQLETVQLDTNSISIQGQGTGLSGTLKANGDLGQLQTEFEQLFDVDEIELAGRLEGDMSWTSDSSSAISATWPIQLKGNFQLNDLIIDLPGLDRFSEASAKVVFSGEGQATREGNWRVDVGSIELTSADDYFRAELTKPVENPSWTTPIEARCEVRGGLATWLARMSPVLPRIDGQSAGTMTLTGDATFLGTMIHLRGAHYTLTDFGYDGYGLQIREPQITGQGECILDWYQVRLQLPDMTLTSSSLAARGVRLDLLVNSQDFQLTGDVAFRSDVNRVSRWFGAGQTEEGVHWFGAAEGTIQLTPVTGSFSGTIQAKIDNLIAARWDSARGSTDEERWELLWQEPVVVFDTRAVLDSNWESIRFDAIRLQSKALELNGSGTVADIYRTVELDLRGNWTPNWSAISAIAQGYSGRRVSLHGAPQAEAFRIQGPLFAPESPAGVAIDRRLVAEATAGWDGGEVFGLAVGPATLQASLRESMITLNDPEIQIGPGKIHLRPIIDLRDQPQLIVTQGKILETVDLNPEMCKGWIRFVAPLLAEATRAQGRLSVETDGLQLPLSQPWAGRGSGKLVIEQATIEAGPLGRQLVQLVNTVRHVAEGNPLESLLNPNTSPLANNAATGAWLELPAQQVPFQLDQQRFIHEGLTMNVAGLPVKTRGAIGIDGTLNLVAEIPVLERWIQRQPALASLKGTSIQVPIGGSLAQPRLDHRAVTQWTTQLLQRAAGGQIESQLHGLLNDALQKSSSQLTPTNGVPAQPASTPTSPDSTNNGLQNAVEENLLKGIDRLLGPKK